MDASSFIPGTNQEQESLFKRFELMAIQVKDLGTVVQNPGIALSEAEIEDFVRRADNVTNWLEHLILDVIRFLKAGPVIGSASTDEPIQAFINKESLVDFKKYLSQAHVPYRDGKGEWQVLQVYLDNGWLPLFRKKQFDKQYVGYGRLTTVIKHFHQVKDTII